MKFKKTPPKLQQSVCSKMQEIALKKKKAFKSLLHTPDCALTKSITLLPKKFDKSRSQGKPSDVDSTTDSTWSSLHVPTDRVLRQE